MNNETTNKIAGRLTHDQSFNGGVKLKAIHQHFTLFLLAIMVLLISILSLSMVFFYQQSKGTDLLIEQQLKPLNSQFQQQTYLIKINALLEDAFTRIDPSHFTDIQKGLAQQNKKISAFDSSNRATYQQWFMDNKDAKVIVREMSEAQPSNDLLKRDTLIQLDTLIDAINIQLKKEETDSKTFQLLSQIHEKLSSSFAMLKAFSLHTRVDQFAQLKSNINELLETDYGKHIAQLANYNQAKEEIVRNLIRLEDMVVQDGLLTKWQASLALMAAYKDYISTAKINVEAMFNVIEKNNISSNVAINNAGISGVNPGELPLWIWLVFSAYVVVISTLLWLFRLRIKVVSQFGLDYFHHVLDNESTPQKTKAKNGFINLHKKPFFCSESFQLLQKIEKINDGRFSEADYQTLVDKNKTLSATLNEKLTQAETLTKALAVAQRNTAEILTAQLLKDQQHTKDLQGVVNKQLILLGCSALNDDKTASDSKKELDTNYLYKSHQQCRTVAQKLSQGSCNSYLHTNKVVLSLSDVNLNAQIEAIALNHSKCIIMHKNKVCIEVDDNIASAVNVDINLFTEAFSAFITLLLSDTTKHKLVIRLSLADKNNGQQKVNFIGQVQCIEENIQLPAALASLNDDKADKANLAEYFQLLLHYQHGENIVAEVIEQAYQLSFTLPMAVNKTQEAVHYPSMVIPKALLNSEQDISMLRATYQAMPIEILLAVKSPSRFIRLQQLLESLGLQVLVVSDKLMLQTAWETGRYAALLTEIHCSPFIAFAGADAVETASYGNMHCEALPRGVFTLDEALAFSPSEALYSHWRSGKLSAESTVKQLIVSLAPWIKEKNTNALPQNNIAQGRSTKTTKTTKPAGPTGDQSSTNACFNFERYSKNQGSPENAMFMLEEYTAENTELITQLTQALTLSDNNQALIAVEALLTNAKIMAADELLTLCENGQKMLKNEGVDQLNKKQDMFLIKVTEAVEAINLYAEEMV